MLSNTRIDTGCLTPELQDQPLFQKQNIPIQYKSTHSTIPSPPLSPCPSSELKASVLELDQPFPMDNLQSCKFKVNAWVGDSETYRSRQLKFLSHYLMSPRKENKPKRKIATMPKRRVVYHSDSDTASDAVRTRRVVRESSQALEDLASSPSSSSPRKKRAKAEFSPSPSLLHDWKSLPDYCPPLSSITSTNSRSLKAEWKGQPMNLSSDDLTGLLHPAEVTLASTLRLPCAVYLDSKRRLFMEKVTRMRQGLPFRRTDAQKSCKIDVNKASRLFVAYEKIGWLEDDNFEKYC